MITRSVEKEKLDNLSLDGEPLHSALKSLAWINRWFGNHNAVLNPLLAICKKEQKTFKIIDLGCGGGDLILALAKKLQKNKISFSITGIDGNQHSLDFAQEKCRAFTEINFIQADILGDDFKIEPCDILISSHFIYHFTNEELFRFFNKNLSQVSKAIICSELERNRFALFLFKLFGFLLPISKLAKQDGLLAIKRSFTKKEWLSIFDSLNFTAFSLKRVPLFRILLIVFPKKST